jgi:hypothetical protein
LDKDASNLLETVAAIQAGHKPKIHIEESGLSDFIDMVLKSKIGDPEKHILINYVYSKDVKSPAVPVKSPQVKKKDTQNRVNKKTPVVREPGVPRSIAFKVEEPDRIKIRSLLKLDEKTPIPRWAITGFGYYRDQFLKDLHSKKVDGGNFNRWFSQQRKLENRKVPQSQIETEWVNLKKKFPNIALLRRPRSGKEKEFRSMFDKFCKTYPSWKSRPKLVENPTERPSINSRKDVAPAQFGNMSGLNGLSGLSEIVRMLQPLRELANLFLISK